MRRLLCILFLSFGCLAFAQEDQQGTKPDTENVIERFDAASPTYRDAFIKMMLTLLGLIILIVLTVWVLRRLSHGRMKQLNYGRSIKIIERRPLSAKSILYLVEVDGKKVMIAESQLEVRAITTADHILPEEE